MSKYNVETIESRLGTGVRISRGDESCEQYILENGLVARLSYKGNGQYVGVLTNPKIKPNQVCYNMFKDITDRLSDYTDSTVDNSTKSFMEYISQNSISLDIKEGIRLQINEKGDFMVMESPVNKLGQRISVAVVCAGLGYGAYNLFKYDIDMVKEVATKQNISWISALGACSLGALLFVQWLTASDSAIYGIHPCSLFGYPGYAVQRAIQKKISVNPMAFIKKFMRNHSEIEPINNRIDYFNSHFTSKRRYTRALEKQQHTLQRQDKLFETIQLQFNAKQKGLSISYRNRSRENVSDFLSDMIEERIIPTDLTNPSLTEVKDIASAYSEETREKILKRYAQRTKLTTHEADRVVRKIAAEDKKQSMG